VIEYSDSHKVGNEAALIAFLFAANICLRTYVRCFTFDVAILSQFDEKVLTLCNRLQIVIAIVCILSNGTLKRRLISSETITGE